MAFIIMYTKAFSNYLFAQLPPLVPLAKGGNRKIQFPPLIKGRVRVGFIKYVSAP